jgi:hypothetical protein
MRHLFTPRPNCVRRQNQDGTLDSTCDRCRLTIGRAFDPDALSSLEARHVCQPVERRRSFRIAYRIYNPRANRVELFSGSAELGLPQGDIEPSSSARET